MSVDSGRAGARAWLGLAVIALPCLVYAMDLTVLNLAVPALSADLRPSSVQLLWIVDSYGFLVAGLLITMGALGDRLGRRRVLLVGAAAFGIASVLAAYAPSAEALIAARVLLGVAGATVAPSTLALIRSMFDDPRQRTVAISVWITSFSTGGAIGPLVGGALLEHFWWGSVFLPGVPVMVLLLLAGPRLLPEFRNPDAGRLDVPSALLGLLAVLAVIYGLKEIAQDGTAWTSVGAVVLGFGLGAAFLHRQRRLPDPLIDLHLFRVPAFSVALTAYTLGFVVNFGSLLFVSQYLQLVLGLSPLAAGACMVPFAAGFVVASLLTPALLRRLRPGPLVAAGLALAGAGFGLLTLVDAGSGPATVVLGTAVVALGLGPVFTVATDLVVGAAPAERAGAASAISETGAELGGALGIAVLGTLGAAIYRSRVTEAMPDGVAPATAAATRDTLGAAADAARNLAEPLGSALLDASRAAFVAGFQAAAAISAVIVLATAALAGRYLQVADQKAGCTGADR